MTRPRLRLCNYLSIALLCLFALGGVPGCGGDEEAKKPAAPAPADGESGNIIEEQANRAAPSPADSAEASSENPDEQEQDEGIDPAGTEWRLGDVQISLNDDHSLGGYEQGGTWRRVRANVFELIDPSGDKFIDLTFSSDGQSGHVFWVDEDKDMQLITRVR